MTAEHDPAVRQVADRRYLVAGFAEALAVLSDQRLSTDPANGLGLHPDITSQPAISQRSGTSMQLCDAPQHNRLRRAVAAALAQRSYATQLDQMKRRADDLFDALLARGVGDLVTDFVLPVVFEVICDLLGVPEVDRAQVHIWSDDSTLLDPEVSTVGAGALDDYVAALLAAKAKVPDDDLCSALAAARDEGRLTDTEAIGTASLMVVAGYETMVSFLSTSALTFLTAPRLGQLLLQRSELMPTALEELLRYVTPTRASWTRFATADVPVGDAVIPAGSAVVVDFASANRDPLRFVSPERFDPTRADNKHLAFGHGAHYCPGAGMARRQSLVAFDVMLPRLHLLTLTTPAAELSWHQNRFSRRPESLPVSVVSQSQEVAQ
jgi:cytochrome P450